MNVANNIIIAIISKVDGSDILSKKGATQAKNKNIGIEKMSMPKVPDMEFQCL